MTMRLELETRRFYLGRDYSEAVEAAGGVPVHLPLIPDKGFIQEALSNVDGILLPGSDTDVDPAAYGEDPHPRLQRVIPEKDETDMLVLAEADRLCLPVLAICFGMQALNVWRGGSLYQDVASQCPSAIKHEQGSPLDRRSHFIKVEKGSRLDEIISSKGLAERVKVNSHHHQAVKLLGKNLEATAWANDGVVECIQDNRPERWLLGVQWHPELDWRRDQLSLGIFGDFIKNCGPQMKGK